MGKIQMTDDLESISGVGPSTADSLIEAGYSTFQSIAVASPGELAQKADLGETQAQKAISGAREEADIGSFETGSDIMSRREKMGRLTFTVPEIDELMGGGLETQCITEFYGEFGAGKSQVTHQMAVNVQLPNEHGGLEGGCLFIDTEDTFRPSRIKQMVRGLNEDVLETVLEQHGFDQYTPEDIKNSTITGDGQDQEQRSPADELAQNFLDNIHVAKALNSNHQIILMDDGVDDQIKQIADSDDHLPIRYMCVDSLTAHFRAEYTGRGELAERQQKLNKHIHDISRIADLHNLVAVVTNQVSADPDSYFGDPTTPIGGHILGHAATHRCYLRKSKDNKRVLKVADSPNLPEGEGVFRVEDGGLAPE